MKLRILVIDDDGVLRRLMTKLLVAGGYEVSTAASGEEGLKLIADGLVPDAIVLDLLMPGLSGFDVLKELRASETGKNLPVLILTGQVAAADQDRALQAGADLYMTKPFSSFELLDTIRLAITVRNSGQGDRRAAS